jgi:O-methyltransferase involved in polyketide biosynthesis
MTAVTNTLFEDVADTASWVAAYRARESARPDAVSHDPLTTRSPSA